MFSDEVVISVIAGKGGDGCVSFRREKFIPYGGPDGGDGGNGGNIILLAKDNTSTLYHLKGKRVFKAKNGQPGMGKNRTGAKGDDKIIIVPIGTIATNIQTGDIIADMIERNQETIIANGGKGGKGNVHFRTSVNQTPRKSTEGKPGEKLDIKLELKLIADVGLVGFPNAGKSTLISRLSNAKPKIASYPFTTLIPNLGVVSYDYHRSYIIADIPGLIEGASNGIGLGIQFLKHIERTNLLLFILDVSEEDFLNKYNILNRELGRYSEAVINKKKCIALNKIDIINKNELNNKVNKLKKHIKDVYDIYPISALSNMNLDNLKKQLYYKINNDKVVQ